MNSHMPEPLRIPVPAGTLARLKAEADRIGEDFQEYTNRLAAEIRQEIQRGVLAPTSKHIDPSDRPQIRREDREAILRALRSYAANRDVDEEPIILVVESPFPKPRQRSLLELRGLGAEKWQGVDPVQYVEGLRNEWEVREH